MKYISPVFLAFAIFAILANEARAGQCEFYKTYHGVAFGQIKVIQCHLCPTSKRQLWNEHGVKGHCKRVKKSKESNRKKVPVEIIAVN